MLHKNKKYKILHHKMNKLGNKKTFELQTNQLIKIFIYTFTYKQITFLHTQQRKHNYICIYLFKHFSKHLFTY